MKNLANTSQITTSEDDTFKALKRVPFNITEKEFENFLFNGHIIPTRKEVSVFLEQRGWEYGEFLKEWPRRA